MDKNSLYNYEIMYIIDEKNEAKSASLKQEFIAILTKDSGTITKEEDSIREFAQEIKHKKRGHYFSIWVKTTPQNIAEFSRIFLIKQHQGDVMRKMIINLDREPHNKFKEVKERPTPPPREFRPRRPFNSSENHGRNNEERPKFNPVNRFKKETTDHTKDENNNKSPEIKS